MPESADYFETEVYMLVNDIQGAVYASCLSYETIDEVRKAIKYLPYPPFAVVRIPVRAHRGDGLTTLLAENRSEQESR